MPNERPETLIIDHFPGFDPTIPSGETTGARVPAKNRMKFCTGVEVSPDGSLRWSRDQFRIAGPSGKTVVSLYEIAFESYNQILAFCSDGKFYALTNLNWTDAGTTPSQWTYGWELFKDTNTSGPIYAWDSGNDIAQNGLYSAAEMVNHLYIPRIDARMMRWDGNALVSVGLDAPATACAADVTYEDPTDTALYTEVDPNGQIAVASDSITMTAFAENTVAYVQRDYGTGGIADYSYDFGLVVSSGAANATSALMVVSNDVGKAWGTVRCNMAWLECKTSNFELNLQTTLTASNYKRRTIGSLAYGTQYYVRVTRITPSGSTNPNLTLEVYSDDTYETLVAKVGCSDSNNLRFAYLYFVAAWELGSAGTWTGVISNLDLTSTSTGSGILPVGKYKYEYTYANDDFESMPSPVSADIIVAAGNTSIALKDIAAPSDGTVTKIKLYRAETSDTSGDVGAYQYLDTITYPSTSFDGTYTDNALLSSLGEAMPYDYALPPWFKDVVYHRERLFGLRIAQTSESYTPQYTTDQQNVAYCTPVSAPAYWPGDLMFTVGDAAALVGGHSWNNYFFFFKTNGVWVLSGYDDSDWNMKKLDDNGMCAYHAVASSQQGVLWWAEAGLMFFDGGSVRTLVPAVDTALTGPKYSDGEDPKIAYHQGRFYLLSGDDLVWWDPQADSWGCETNGAITAGIRGVNLGENQRHLLCQRKWSPDGDAEISVLHTGRAFTNYAGEGSSESTYYAPVSMILTPLIAAPDEEIHLQELWVDAAWTGPADGVKLQLSNDAATWTDVCNLANRNATSGYRGNLLRETEIGSPVYIRFYGTEAANFRLYLVKLVYVRRAIRASASV